LTENYHCGVDLSKMSTKLIVELKYITPEWIADLQQQYSDATLEISILL